MPRLIIPPDWNTNVYYGFVGQQFENCEGDFDWKADYRPRLFVTPIVSDQYNKLGFIADKIRPLESNDGTMASPRQYTYRLRTAAGGGSGGGSNGGGGNGI